MGENSESVGVYLREWNLLAYSVKVAAFDMRFRFGLFTRLLSPLFTLSLCVAILLIFPQFPTGRVGKSRAYVSHLLLCGGTIVW